MEPQLLEGFKVEIGAIEEKLATKRTALQHIDESEEAAAVRFEIGEHELLLNTIIKTRDALTSAETSAEERPRRFRAWRANVAKTRDALAAVESLARPIEECQLQLDQARQNFDNAQFALADFRQHPIANRDYAAQTVIRRWDDQCAKLEKIVEERGSTLRALNVELQKLQGDRLRAQQALDSALFTERMSRIPMPDKIGQPVGGIFSVA
jgi:hypothetical protein